MPKKQNRETPEEQSERFKREAQRLIDAGELNPTEADEAIERILRQSSGSAPSEADPQ
jgi:hypothetical protein